MTAVDWPTFLGEAYNVFFIAAGLLAGIFTVFRGHKTYVEHRQEMKDTKEAVEELKERLTAQDKTLADIKKKLTMNGKNTRNPGDLLGLICDKLGIEIPE